MNPKVRFFSLANWGIKRGKGINTFVLKAFAQGVIFWCSTFLSQTEGIGLDLARHWAMGRCVGRVDEGDGFSKARDRFWVSGNSVGISINLSKSEEEKLFINDSSQRSSESLDFCVE